MANYIRDSVRHGKLIDWTVAIMSNSQDSEPHRLVGYEIGRSTRSPYDLPDPHPDIFAFNRLIDPSHEAFDLDDVERANALASAQLANPKAHRQDHLIFERPAHQREAFYLFTCLTRAVTRKGLPDRRSSGTRSVSLPRYIQIQANGSSTR